MTIDAKSIIARRVAQELKDGERVNPGIGLPTLVAQYIDQFAKFSRRPRRH